MWECNIEEKMSQYIFAHGCCLIFVKVSSTEAKTMSSWKIINISSILKKVEGQDLQKDPLTGNWLEASSRKDPKCLSKAWSSLKASRMGNPLSMEAERGRTPQRQPPVTRDELLDVLEVIRSLEDLRHLSKRGFVRKKDIHLSESIIMPRLPLVPKLLADQPLMKTKQTGLI